MDSYRLLYVTMADHTTATELARRLVRERLAACTHVLPMGRSFYWWQGELMEGSEVLIIAKTRSDLAETAIETIAAWHAYDCPCVLSLPVDAGFAPFLNWVSQETQAK